MSEAELGIILLLSGSASHPAVSVFLIIQEGGVGGVGGCVLRLKAMMQRYRGVK